MNKVNFRFVKEMSEENRKETKSLVVPGEKRFMEENILVKK